MSDLYSDHDEPASPEDLCRQAFSRCSNWPEDRAGQLGLAQGLKMASGRCHVTQEELIARCRETSAFCPTDADLLRVAGDMIRERQTVEEPAERQRKLNEWSRKYGPPKPFEPITTCLCCGREWAEIIRTAKANYAAKAAK